MNIRIGTRGSKLARWQADWVASELAKHGVATEIIFLETLGDVQAGPLGNVGGQGLFTKEIQRALLNDDVDVAVHSLKDLPTEKFDGLSLASVPVRENCGDALIARATTSLNELPTGAKIGTGSARRRAQLLAYRNDLQVLDIRGNVDTRLKKLNDGEFDAIVLAEAGLRRLGLADQIAEVLPKSIVLPAVGQGALGLEIRSEDTSTREAVRQLDDEPTHQAVLAERSLLKSLRGGCLAPVGAWARHEDGGQLRLEATVLNRDGSQQLKAQGHAVPDAGVELGARVAEQLLTDGAEALLAVARSENDASNNG